MGILKRAGNQSWPLDSAGVDLTVGIGWLGCGHLGIEVRITCWGYLM